MGNELSDLVQWAHPPQIEQLRMNEGDKSRRLPDEFLEQFWAVDSQKIPLQLPQWTTRDPIVKQMALKNPSSPQTHSPKSSFSTPSHFASPPKLQTSERSSILHVGPENVTYASNTPMTDTKQLPEPRLKSSRKASMQGNRKGRGRSGTKAVHFLRPSKPSAIKKQAYGHTSRTKAAARHTMQTRSQGATTLYALASNDSAVSYRRLRGR